MRYGVISVSMYLLPAMKMTEPYSPTARANASAKPVSSAGVRLGRMTRNTVCQRLAPREAAASLGATSLQTFLRITFPTIMPAMLTGFALAFARALGEYGSVIFIAGNMPMISEITPLLIITKLEQYDYAGATAIAVVMLVISFVLLLVINSLQTWARKRQGGV